MKLMYLMTEPMGVGGVQSDMLALSKDLTRRSHEVYVATTSGVLVSELERNGARFVDINFHFNGLAGFLKAALDLRRAICEYQIEILAPQSVRSTLISFFACRLMPFSYRVTKTGRRLPIVTTIHNIHNPVHFKYSGWLLQHCSDFVIFESHYERNRLLNSGLEETKSKVIHSGIDTNKFIPIEPCQPLTQQYHLDKSRHLVFGIVARLSEEKGHQYLLYAFKKVVEKLPHARLLIVGDGPLMGAVKQLCADLYLNDHVIFSGLQRNIAEFLSIFDVFVLASTRESFPLAAREAMAAGRAVIAPRIGGCPEVVEDGKTGYLYQAANIEDLTEKMLKIQQNAQFKEMGRAARQRVIDQFSLSQWINGDEAVYLKF
jgi:L-malate glycosyltransferase